MSSLYADWETHHIQGYARAALEAGKPGEFRAPLISHITGNLYVGGCINGVDLGDKFKHVVSLYKWERYRFGPFTSLHEYEMYDAGDIPDPDLLEQIAADINRYVTEGPTLVHCQAGLNRSNLCAALALIRAGNAPADAIALLRGKRHPVVLCNQAFEQWLLTQSPGVSIEVVEETDRKFQFEPNEHENVWMDCE